MASKAGSWLKRLDIDFRGWILVPEAVSWLLRPDLSFGGQILAPETGFWLQRLDIGSKIRYWL